MTTRDERTGTADAVAARSLGPAATVESIVDGLPESIVLYDVHGRITFANAEFCRRVRRTNEQLVGFRPFEWDDGTYSEPHDAARFREHLDATIATGQPLGLIRENRQPSGQVLIYQVSFSPLHDEAGQIVGAVMLGQDISDLTTAQRGLTEREREFRSLAESLPDVVMRYDTECRTTYINRPVPGGPTPETRLGLRPTECPDLDPTDAAEYEACLRSVLATGEQATIDRRVVDESGDVRIHSALVCAERDDDGRVVGLIAIGRDVTDLVHAHRELAENEHRFRTLADNIPEVLVRYDRDGRAIYANRQFALQVGGPSLVGRVPEDEPSRSIPFGLYRETLRDVLATGRPGRAELSPRGPDGHQRSISVHIQPEFDADGNIAGAITIGHDVTDLVLARQEAAAREREFRSLAHHLPDIIRRYDLDLRATYANHTPHPACGDDVSSVLGLRPTELVTPVLPMVEEYERKLAHVVATGEPASLSMTFPDAHGNRFTYHLVIHAERDHDGTIIGAITIGRDITDLLRAEREISASERKFRSLAENAVDHIARWDTQGRRTYINPAMARHLGGSDDLLGRVAGDAPHVYADVAGAIHEVVAAGRSRTVEQRSVDTDGTERVWEVRLVPEFDDVGELTSVLGIGRDITEVVHQREALERAARTDALTGTASRQVLYERVPVLLDGLQASGGQLAMLLVDLDGFKHINDQYGHRLGDRILKEAACRFTLCVDAGDLLVRIGGDEFVIVMTDVESATDASLLAHRLRMHLAELSQEEPGLPALDASVGIAMAPHDGGDVDVLLAHADLALYEAKRSGRGRAEFYRSDLRAAMERRSAIEQALRDCLPDTEMALHLQPICTLGADPSVWGAEALLRWNHPQLGPVRPDEFIPIAEQSGQIVPIGRWVLRRAAEIAVGLNTGRAEPLRISVNVSTRQFVLDDIAVAVAEALDATGCDPGWIVVELTESLMLEDLPLVRRALDALRSLGVALAIDDFGTGYSALHYLTRMRVDHMKIDKSFLRDADVDHQQQEIVRALMAMADALGIGVVAEGIETAGQAALLEQLGCRLGQGYLLAHPMRLDAFETWLATAPASLRDALPV